jgi:hypothetical protein
MAGCAQSTSQAFDVIYHVTGREFTPIHPINNDHIIQPRRQPFEDTFSYACGAKRKV